MLMVSLMPGRPLIFRAVMADAFPRRRVCRRIGSRSGCLGAARGWVRETAGSCGLPLYQVGAQLPHVETVTSGEGFFGFANFGDDWVRIHAFSKLAALFIAFPASVEQFGVQSPHPQA